MMVGGGYVLNKMTGNPAGRLTKRLTNKVRGKKSSTSNSEPIGNSKNQTDNYSSDHHNAKSYEGQNNPSAHGNTPFDELSNYTEKYRNHLNRNICIFSL